MDWRALERSVDGIVGAAFGESVRLSFLAGGTVDPDRAAVTCRGILYVGADAVAAGFNVKYSAAAAALVIDRSAYTGPMPKAGDKVRALERTGQPWFEVKSVNDRHSNLLIAELAEA